jgi:mono/diheme cytochrome c family protein
LNRFAKYALVATAGVSVLAGSLAAFVLITSSAKQDRVMALKVAAVPYKTGQAAVDAGKYLFDSRGCADCHGETGQGKVMIEESGGMYVKAPNITSGAGSPVEKYTEADWVRTIRHGVKPSGKPVLIMPSEDYNRLTDDDLGNIVAYVRQLPSQPGGIVEMRLPFIFKTVYALGVYNDAATKIDHSLPPSQPVPASVSTEHGAYVANACIGCHGAKLAGGKIPGAPPDWPPAANLTSVADGAMRNYPDAAAFAKTMRSGVRPDGSKISAVMPFAALRSMNDVDLMAMYLHLKSLPPVMP